MADKAMAEAEKKRMNFLEAEEQRAVELHKQQKLVYESQRGKDEYERWKQLRSDIARYKKQLIEETNTDKLENLHDSIAMAKQQQQQQTLRKFILG